MKMLVHSIVGLTLTVMTQAAAAEAPAQPRKNSSIEITTTKDASGNAKMTFRVIPEGNMVINDEGPWRLDLVKSEGLSLAKTKFERSDFDFKFPGWQFASTSAPASAAGEIEYRATVFVCTKDKAQCFRDVHKGTTKWSLAAAKK